MKGLRAVTSREVTKEEWRSGLTWRVVLAIIYGAAVLMPVTIWGELMIGSVGNLTWTVVILFYWLSLLYGSPLTKQEILVMFAAVHTAVYASIGLNFHHMFYRVWFANSPIAEAYGISKYLPYWWVPENPLIRTQALRTFLHASWIPVVATSLIFWIMNLIIGLSLGFFFYQLFVEAEKLPFPMARVSVEVITELWEREPMKMRVMVLFALIGFIYSLIAYGVPILSQTFIGVPVVIIPYPWYDLTESFKEVLPGAMIGIDTNLISYMMGMIIPFEVVVYMFLSSFLISVLGNPIIVWYCPELIPKWVGFPKGMKLADILFWSNIYVWYAVSIGAGFGVFFETLIRGRRELVQSIKSLSKLSAAMKRVGYLSLRGIIIVYLVITVLWFLLLEFVLIPGFPWLPLLLLIVFWPFIHGVISARAVGETGFPINIPYLNSNVLLITMEACHIPVHSELGIWPWFAPLGVSSGEGWTSTFYICRGVRCTFSSYIKAVLLIAAPVAILFNFLYSEYLWKMTPIPSPMFQYAQIFWPITAAQSVLWYTRRIYSFNPNLIIGGFASILAASAVASLLKVPFSAIGLLMGLNQPLPTPLAVFIGAAGSRLIEKISKGKINLRKYAYVMIGGYIIGMSVAMALSVSLSIFVKSLWPLPY